MDKWIPVSERLPEEREWYLAVFKEKDTGYQLIPRVADYIGKGENKWRLIDDDGFVPEYRDLLECVAWMPLPKPYELQESEDKEMSNTDVITEVLLKFTEPYLAIGETNHDNKAYNNLLAICFIHDYCYDLIRENAELKGNEYSIVKAREKAIRHLGESIVSMRDLLDDLRAESGDKE